MDVVAYQGEAGAFSEEGARALFPDAEHRPLPSIRTVFESVEVGRTRWGLVPMDNSQAGSINETYDLFLRHGLHLVGRDDLPRRPLAARAARDRDRRRARGDLASAGDRAVRG